MEKALERIKTIAVCIIILLITAISILGLTSREKGIWTDILPDYTLGMDYNGLREIRFTLSTNENEQKVYVDENGKIRGRLNNGSETKESDSSSAANGLVLTQDENTEKPAETDTNKVEGVDFNVETRTLKDNEDENINIYNFNLAKKIIQKRLESRANYEYNIRMDSVTGDMIVELPDSDNMGVLESLVTTRGKVEIIDYQNGVVLLDNSNISKVRATYQTTEQYAYQAYMQIYFDKEGTEKLREISKNYTMTTDANGEDQYKYISIMVEDSPMRSTYFKDEIGNGVLNVPMGDATTDSAQFTEILNSLNDLVIIINSDTLPLKYTVTSDDFIMSEFTDQYKLIGLITLGVCFILVTILFVVKFEKRGFIASIIGLGYGALVSLALRYTKVPITYNSTIAFVGNLVIFYAFLYMLLKELRSNYSIKSAYLEVIKKLYVAIIPVCVILVIFTFMNAVIINSIGMTLFWGVFVQLIYSFIVVYLLRIV